MTKCRLQQTTGQNENKREGGFSGKFVIVHKARNPLRIKFGIQELVILEMRGVAHIEVLTDKNVLIQALAAMLKLAYRPKW